MSMRILPDSQSNDWQDRLGIVTQAVRRMYLERDPDSLMRAAESVIRLSRVDRILQLTSRGLQGNQFRIIEFRSIEHEARGTPSSELPGVLEGGVLAELVWSGEPRIIDRLELAPNDPAIDYLLAQGSLMAIPTAYDQEGPSRMLVFLDREPGAFSHNELPESIWIVNIMGVALRALALSQELDQAYSLLDSEFKTVANIQRALLPVTVPQIPTMTLAVDYRTARRAGGDYYDFFPLPDGRWGIFIADVSGHGVPAAVVMAITHGIAHSYPGPLAPPSRLLEFVNRQLTRHYTTQFDSFVTAFYGIYDSASRLLCYSCAGHNPPRLMRPGTVISQLDNARRLPLGISDDESYEDCTEQLAVGDQLVFYTDGITEAHDPSGNLFTVERLDQILARSDGSPADLIRSMRQELDLFTAGRPATDDQTLLVARIS